MTWQVWNIRHGRPIGRPVHNMRDAIRSADALEARFQRPYAVLPVPLES